MMNDRLTELESRFAFQDETIASLNDVVIRQQREIDRLTQAIEQLKVQLQTISPMAPDAGDEPPPHY